MENSEIPIKINPLERKSSNPELDYIHREIERDLVAARKGIRYGDKVSIFNERKKGLPDDEITLSVDKKQSSMKIRSGNWAKQYDVSLPNGDPKKGFSLKEILCGTKTEDGHIIRASAYDTIKSETGIDLENLDDNLKVRGAIPLRLEGGALTVKNKQTGMSEVILMNEKNIFCREGKIYNMSTEGYVPSSKDYELLAMHHYHPGINENQLIPSADDMLTFFKLKVPGLIFKDSLQDGFTGKEYKIKENINLKEAEREMENIKNLASKDPIQSQNLTNELINCKRAAEKYFTTRDIKSFEKLDWTK